MPPCWTCHHYDGLDAAGFYGHCARSGGSRVQASPATGCVFWEREPGADDTGEPPAHYRAGAASEGWSAVSKRLAAERTAKRKS